MIDPLPLFAFDGQTYNAKRDHERLNKQLQAVRNLMADGQWRTLAVISKEVGGSEPSVSARLRDLRKQKFGGLTVDREYVANGVWKYRVVA